MAFNTNYYKVVTDRIVNALENGTPPWVRPYSTTEGRNIPCNAVTNRPYSGINVLLYWDSIASGYSKPRFLTFNQAKNAGGWVKKGEKGTPVYLFKPMTSKDKKTGEDKKWLMLRQYTVFNVAQCENLPDSIVNGPEVVVPHNSAQREALADAFINSTGAKIVDGERPCYIPSLDIIQLPKWEEFHGNHQFYATTFHELVHWTGDKTRCDRDLRGRFGTAAYAAEELVAELGAAFIAAEFGFDVVDNSASYIASWIRLLKDDPRAIFTAASKAQQAVNFLRDIVSEDEEENINEVAAEAA